MAATESRSNWRGVRPKVSVSSTPRCVGTSWMRAISYDPPLRRKRLQRTADQAGQHATKCDYGQADERVGKAAFGGLDGSDASASRHVLVARKHDEKPADRKADGRAQRDELVEKVDDRSWVHSVPPWGRAFRPALAALMAVQSSLLSSRLEGVPKPFRRRSRQN